MQSVVGRLRERRVELAQGRTKLMEVPGFNGDLIAEYRALTWQELQDVGKRVRKEFTTEGDRILYGAVDMLIAACTQILINVNGKMKPLSEEELPIRFDGELAEALGFKASTAREALQGAFNNDLAIVSTAMSLTQWMEGERQEVDQTLMGE
jgi:hypothetical protein